VFREIIDYYKWDCCQIQFNYLDVNYQAGTKGLKYAGSKGIAVIVMEPIRGGKLAIPVHKLNTRPEIKKILDNSKVKRTMADWALQFVWNHSDVSVVLSGMSSMQQVKENIRSAENSCKNSLKKKELMIMSELRKAFDKYIIVPCTSCEYCLPCPNGVAIPMVIRLLNELAYWGDLGRPRISLFYNSLIKTQKELNEKLNSGDEAEGAANLCIQCGECIDKCPQQINIPDIMKKTSSIFEENKKVTDYF
jgi:predicted aldo/keto reductase-like oxidoreductase